MKPPATDLLKHSSVTALRAQNRVRHAYRGFVGALVASSCLAVVSILAIYLAH